MLVKIESVVRGEKPPIAPKWLVIVVVIVQAFAVSIVVFNLGG